MNKAIQNTILASIFLVPLASVIPIHGTIIWYPQLLALMAIGFICLALLWWDTNKFISLFLIYTTFSYLFVCSQSPRAMLCLMTGYLAIMVGFLASRSNPYKIYQAIGIMAAINAVFVVMQVFKLDPIFIPDTNALLDRTVGFMGSRNQLGIFHSTSSVILLFISPWLAMLSFPVLLVKCSSAFAGLMAGASAYLFFQGKKFIGSLIIFMLALSVPVFIQHKKELVEELKERGRLWALTIEQGVKGELLEDDAINPISDLHRKVSWNPILGAGIGNFFVLSPMSQGIMWKKGTHQMWYEHAHNDFVESFFEFGYLGTVLILLCIAGVISDFMSSVKTKGVLITFSALICLSVCSLGIYVFHAPVSLFIFCLTLGLFYAEVRNAKQSQIATNPA